MTLPSSDYDIATLVNPTAALTDFSLMVDLSRLSAAWWSLVDTSEGRKGRAAKDDGTELPVDFIDFDNVAKTGWARIKWSGTLATTGAQTVRVYPPMAANSTVIRSTAFGAYNAYDGFWNGYWPLHNTGNRLAATGELVSTIGKVPALVAGKVGNARLFDDANTEKYENATDGPFLTAFPLTLLTWTKFDDFGATQPTPACVGGAAGESDYVRLRYNSGVKPQMNMSSGATEDSSGTVTINTWHQTGFRVTSSDAESILDGAGSGSPTAHTQTWNTVSDMVIGARRVNGVTGHYMSGVVDDVQVHSTNRSDAWISEEYDQTNDQATFWGAWTNVTSAAPALTIKRGGTPVADGATINLGSIVQDAIQSLTFDIENTGTSDALIGVVALSAGLTATDDPSGATIIPTGLDALVVSLDTSVAGAVSETISIPSDDPLSPWDVTITATVSAPVVVSSTNMDRRGASFLSSQRHAAMAETVIYRRGIDQVSIKATVGRTESQDQGISDLIVDIDRIDFLMRLSDLVLSAATITPQDGDEIEYDNGGGAVVYTVRRDQADRVYRPTTEFGFDARVHTTKRGAP